MSDVGYGRNYFYEGLFDAEEPQDAEQRRAFAREREAQIEKIRLLRFMLGTAKNGLIWYYESCPELVNGCDHEAMAAINVVLEITK